MEKKIELASEKECCGCAACFNICPKEAISMKSNESGFLYPEINVDKCIQCGACESACPVLDELKPIIKTQPSACLIQHTDDRIRKESTSGGAFTAIAEVVISKGGIVFGAAMQEDFVVRHCCVEKKEGLSIFRNSKYVQSEIGDSYRRAKKYLLLDRWVLFSGTPCQIHGLLKYLGKKYDKLITVDLVCHSVPSPAVFAKYLELQLEKYPDINKIMFRDKTRGYDYSTMAFYKVDSNGNEKCLYRKGSESDLWFRSFLPGLCDRENCYQCIFQEYPRCSDITIWDCFTVKKLYPEFDDNKGTTSVVIWTEIGKKIIYESETIRKYDLPVDVFLSKINREKFKKLKINRDEMYRDLKILTAKDFFDKYRKATLKIKLKGIVREILYYTGLQSIAKQLKNSFGDRSE